MTTYHHAVEIKFGCGCHVEDRFELIDGEEPSGLTAGAALFSSLNDPRIQAAIAHPHEMHGEEKIDIHVRTKVGPIPDDWGEEGFFQSH
jgi:hypothetical protein